MLNLARKIFIFVCFMSAFSSLQAKTFQVTSGDKQTLLLELYTSQGCSSCPPADEWLSGLKRDQRLWKEVFPVAFHVDYWNYIGWTDPYSKDSFSNRQRRYAASGNVSSVYTPGFIANGKEWRSWFRQPNINRVTDTLNAKPGRLSLSVDEQQIHVVFSPTGKLSQTLQLNAAWLKMAISTDVLNGENGGKTLHHDFVCSDWQRFEATRQGDDYSWQQTLKPGQLHQADALVVWVSSGDSQTPIQTTGLLLQE